MWWVALFPPIHGDTRIVCFRPGFLGKYNLDLRKVYKITEPGQYTVTASRTEETKDGKVVVNSNRVTLGIFP
jgi:hypothetical protein